MQDRTPSHPRFSSTPTKDRKIWVGNLPQRTPVDELRRLFSPYGNIISAQVGAKDFGFVEFEFPDSVDRAIKGESGRLYRGLKLDSPSKPHTNNTPPPANRNFPRQRGRPPNSFANNRNAPRRSHSPRSASPRRGRSAERNRYDNTNPNNRGPPPRPRNSRSPRQASFSPAKDAHRYHTERSRSPEDRPTYYHEQSTQHIIQNPQRSRESSRESIRHQPHPIMQSRESSQERSYYSSREHSREPSPQPQSRQVSKEPSREPSRESSREPSTERMNAGSRESSSRSPSPIRKSRGRSPSYSPERNDSSQRVYESESELEEQEIPQQKMEQEEPSQHPNEVQSSKIMEAEEEEEESQTIEGLTSQRVQPLERSKKAIFVRNIPLNVPDGKITKLFNQFGSVVDTTYVLEKTTGFFVGTCIVIFEREDAATASLGINGSMVYGQPLAVEYAPIVLLPQDQQGYSKPKMPTIDAPNNNNPNNNDNNNEISNQKEEPIPAPPKPPTKLPRGRPRKNLSLKVPAPKPEEESEQTSKPQNPQSPLPLSKRKKKSPVKEAAVPPQPVPSEEPKLHEAPAAPGPLESPQTPAKRGRGRPPKNKTGPQSEEKKPAVTSARTTPPQTRQSLPHQQTVSPQQAPPKKKRGRPPKVPKVVPTETALESPAKESSELHEDSEKPAPLLKRRRMNPTKVDEEVEAKSETVENENTNNNNNSNEDNEVRPTALMLTESLEVINHSHFMAGIDVEEKDVVEEKDMEDSPRLKRAKTVLLELSSSEGELLESTPHIPVEPSQAAPMETEVSTINLPQPDPPAPQSAPQPEVSVPTQDTPAEEVLVKTPPLDLSGLLDSSTGATDQLLSMEAPPESPPNTLQSTNTIASSVEPNPEVISVPAVISEPVILDISQPVHTSASLASMSEQLLEVTPTVDASIPVEPMNESSEHQEGNHSFDMASDGEQYGGDFSVNLGASDDELIDVGSLSSPAQVHVVVPEIPLEWDPNYCSAQEDPEEAAKSPNPFATPEVFSPEPVPPPNPPPPVTPDTLELLDFLEVPDDDGSDYHEGDERLFYEEASEPDISSEDEISGLSKKKQTAFIRVNQIKQTSPRPRRAAVKGTGPIPPKKQTAKIPFSVLKQKLNISLERQETVPIPQEDSTTSNPPPVIDNSGAAVLEAPTTQEVAVEEVDSKVVPKKGTAKITLGTLRRLAASGGQPPQPEAQQFPVCYPSDPNAPVVSMPVPKKKRGRPTKKLVIGPLPLQLVPAPAVMPQVATTAIDVTSQEIILKRYNAVTQQVEYLIQWEGYPITDSSWIPLPSLAFEDLPLVADFDERWLVRQTLEEHRIKPQKLMEETNVVMWQPEDYTVGAKVWVRFGTQWYPGQIVHIQDTNEIYPPVIYTIRLYGESSFTFVNPRLPGHRGQSSVKFYNILFIRQFEPWLEELQCRNNIDRVQEALLMKEDYLIRVEKHTLQFINYS